MAKNKGGRPPKFTSVEQVETLIEDYFKNEAYMGEGDNKMFAPTMSGLAYKLDMCRKTLLNYSKDDKFLHTIKRARERVHQALEQRLYGNNVAGIIFNLKNNFDWQDKSISQIGGIEGNPLTLAIHEISGRTLEPGSD